MIDFFTKQEKVFVVFLLFGLIIGSGIELYQSHFKPNSEFFKREQLEEIERQIHDKAALIDSIMDNKKLSAIENEHSLGLNKVLPENRVYEGTSQQRLIDINSATVEELMKLPRVGPVIANRIIEYRNIHGPFKTIEDLIKVKGIGEKKLTSIKPYIYIKSK